MIPQISCSFHPNENIALVDLSKQAKGNSRTYCLECLQTVKLDQPCQIKHIPNKATAYIEENIQQITEKYTPSSEKLIQAAKTLITIRDTTAKWFNDQLILIELVQQILMEKIENEKSYLDNMKKDYTKTTLEEIATLLSEDNVKQLIDIDEYTQLGPQIVNNWEQLKQNLQQQIGEIYNIINGKIEKQSQLRLLGNNFCQALASNEKQSMIAGGVGKNIMIWEQKELQLIQSAFLTGHRSFLTFQIGALKQQLIQIDGLAAIVIYNSGYMMISGGSDNLIKLWKNIYNKWNFIQTNKWNCIQTLSEHTGGITDLKLTLMENQVISTSRDKSIKVWTMNQEQNQFQYVQTLSEHTNEVGYVSISSNSQLMATSSFENYFDIFFNTQENEQESWMIYQQIQTEGLIHRIHFIDDTTLICQQQDPAKLIIYECNEFTIKQSIVLNEPDSECILFPIFECRGSIYCKNDKFVYVIKKSALGQYYFEKNIQGEFWSGCVDIRNQNIILGNIDNKTIEFYNILSYPL